MLEKNLFFRSVHTATKLDVGYRLSRSGLAVAYGHDVEFLGPLVSDISYINGSATLNVTYGNVSNIDLRSPDGFDVLIFLSSKELFRLLLSFRFVVAEVSVQSMEDGIHHRLSTKMV